MPLAKNLRVTSLGPRQLTALAAGGVFAAPSAVNALLGPLARSAPTVPTNRNQARAPTKDEGDSLRYTEAEARGMRRYESHPPPLGNTPVTYQTPRLHLLAAAYPHAARTSSD